MIEKVLCEKTTTGEVEKEGFYYGTEKRRICQ